jgi:anti-sigma-K factor RskA
MSTFTTTLSAAGIAALLATPAFAQQATPWELQEGRAHVVDMEGKMKVMQPKDKTMETLKKRAKPVSKGTIFFMNNGQLYQTQGSKDLFDDF